MPIASSAMPSSRRVLRGLALLLFVLCAVPVWAQAGKANAPAGMQVWNASPLQRIAADTTPPAQATPGPIELVAPRNGVASGQVVVSAPAAFSGLQARVSELKTAGGALPAGAVRVRYADISSSFVPLYDEPVADQLLQPVWVTVQVPADARTGKYTGTLTIDWADKPVNVPIALTVYGWAIADPHDWKNCTNLLQSPESVANYYNVPMWSDEHFALMEKSLELMGQLGNDIIGISAVSKDVFGDDPMIVFKRVNGKLTPDFTYVNRYLDLYAKHAGAPLFVSVNVWNYNMYTRGFGRGAGGTTADEPDTIQVAELQNGKLGYADVPMYGHPGSEEVWQPVFDGLRDIVKQRGWRESCLLLGTSGDTWASPTTIKFFRKIAPYAQWRTLTHGQGSPKWSYSDDGRTQPNGMVTGYHESARRLPNNRVHLPDHPVTCNSRDEVGVNPATYRGLAAILDFQYDYDGVCWKGIDYWPYRTASGAMRTALKAYADFGNMVGGTPRAICAPGPKGAVATQQFEMFREGLQDCEALFTIRDGLDQLYPPPVAKCDVTELVLQNGVCKDDAKRPGNLILTVYYHNGQVGVVPQATGFNSFKREGQGKVTKTDPLTFEVQITLDRDSNGQDCRGSYTIQVTRQGNSYTGTYTGTYRGVERKGDVIGSFQPKAYELTVGEPAPKTAQQTRCEALNAEYLAKLGAAEKTLMSAADLRDLAGKLYGTATEITDAIAKAGK